MFEDVVYYCVVDDVRVQLFTVKLHFDRLVIRAAWSTVLKETCADSVTTAAAVLSLRIDHDNHT